MNVFALACSCAVAFSGYVAVKVCRNVHVERPRASTSGGQSDGRTEGVAVEYVSPEELEIEVGL